MRIAIALAFVATAPFGCSSSEATCVPGASVACAGPASCPGFQTCNADGTAFGECDCSGETTGTSTSTSSSTSGDGGAGGTTTSTTSSSTSSTGEGGGGASSWSPLDLAGLALWLDPDTGIVEDPQHPGTVLKWQDQSGNGHLATAINVQDGFRFDIDPVALNGHDAIRCHGNGTWLDVPSAPSLEWGTGDFAVAMVLKIDSNGVSSRYFEKDANQGNLVLLQQSSQSLLQFQIGGNTVAGAIQDVTKFHVVIMRGQALSMLVDASSATGPTAALNVDNPGASVHICVVGQGPQSEIAEVVAVDGALSDADQAKLATYLQQKFGL